MAVMMIADALPGPDEYGDEDERHGGDDGGGGLELLDGCLDLQLLGDVLPVREMVANLRRRFPNRITMIQMIVLMMRWTSLG